MNIKLRPYQENSINKLRSLLSQGNKRLLLQASTGAGKCLGEGTPILMYDGTIKSVEDVVIGDRLMGPDSKPRTVLSLARGKEEMYRVTPVKGDSYIVNASHILSLKKTSTKSENSTKRGINHHGEIVNINVVDFKNSNKTFRHIHKGWRTGVDFKNNHELDLDPYYLGLWLGDGSSRIAAITTGDIEVIEYLNEYTQKLGLFVRIEDNSVGSVVFHPTTMTRGGLSDKNKIINSLRLHDLIQNKHIPHVFKTASRKSRLKLLAGFIDSDGSYDGGGYDIIGVNEKLIDDVIFLARSLGFSAYKKECIKSCCHKEEKVFGTYYRACISGHISEIPCLIERKKANPRLQKKSVLVTGLTVESIGIGDYYGFEIDGDHLFMLGDFTVTHNTVIGSEIIRSAVEKGKNCLFVAHRREIIEQTSAKLDQFGINHGVIMSGHRRYKPLLPVQVAAVQTLNNRHKPAADVVIFDECHLSISKSFLALVEHYKDSVILGLTATPIRLDGRGLGEIYQSIVQVVPMSELISEGFLVRPRVFAPFLPDMAGVKTVRGDFDAAAAADIMDKSSITGDIVKHWQQYAAGKMSIVFAASVAHSQHIVEAFNAAGISARHLDGTTDNRIRERTLADFKAGKFKILANCGLFIEGLDIVEIGCVILARPTQSLTIYLQAVGRGMRPALGKTECIVLDHAGLTHRHGLVDEPREWSLEGKKKKSRKNDEEKAPTVTICEMCFSAFSRSEHQDKCPECGHDLPKRERAELGASGEGELVELTAEHIAAIRAQKKKELLEARTLDQLIALGKQRGYKNPLFWAKKMQEGREQWRAKRHG